MGRAVCVMAHILHVTVVSKVLLVDHDRSLLPAHAGSNRSDSATTNLAIGIRITPCSLIAMTAAWWSESCGGGRYGR